MNGKLTEGTSNFGRGIKSLPLLVFFTIDELPEEGLDQMTIDDLNDRIDQFNDYLIDISSDLADFNDQVDDEYYSLNDINIHIEPGYYEGAYIDLDENCFNNLSENYKELIRSFLYSLKKEFGLIELNVAGTFSNGETLYNKVEEHFKNKLMKEGIEDIPLFIVDDIEPLEISIEESGIILESGEESGELEIIENNPELIGVSQILSDLIKDEWEAIDGYKSAISTLVQLSNSNVDGKLSSIVDILNDIWPEESIHIGQLEKCLSLISPNSDKISEGELEADQQLKEIK